ncbi:MAG: hypothetical protein U0794_09530 [Isosphaeraceae bacterium]
MVALVGLLVSTLLSHAQAGEPSPEYRASLRRTLELRRARRVASAAPVGRIETFPMPPALVIRQTRERHDEIGSLLDLLRYGSR